MSKILCRRSDISVRRMAVGWVLFEVSFMLSSFISCVRRAVCSLLILAPCDMNTPLKTHFSVSHFVGAAVGSELWSSLKFSIVFLRSFRQYL
ncbi:hypothetical protein GDO78_018732 [Eleutherodactylus coqui]|uniref:Uncharacterized protein n=1 Tax=Eleutherodactylus coqui TaxID=57060 RepID=A0A8J6BLJ2_ELECQ|nr:hypothetical protein GDO78_018732 [Eleutherodactylus coqui]